MTKWLLGGVCAASLLFNIAGASAQCTVPNTFTAGTTAASAQVNANFSALTGCALPASGGTLTGGTLAGTTMLPGGAITSSGSLGIGTTSPDSPLSIVENSSGSPAPPSGTYLHIVGPNSTAPRVFLDSFAIQGLVNYRRADGTEASPSAVQSGENLGGFNWFGYGATGYSTGSRAVIAGYAAQNWTDTAQGTYIAFSTTANGTATATESMRVDNTGYVGVGTTTPDTLLTVGSSIPSGNVAHFQNSSGSCYINPTSTSLSCSSDLRLKRDIAPIASDNALSGVLALQPITFNWRNEGVGAPPHSGFVAQDVAKVFPDLVARGADGYETLNYAGFAPYFADAIQQQQAEIADLKESIGALRAANDDLRRQLAKVTRLQASGPAGQASGR